MRKAIYRLYRPATFNEVSGQEHVVRTLRNQYGSGTLAHAYLFAGPRGVGKTTMARLLAKLVNCASPKKNEPCNSCEACRSITSGRALDVYEIDAASHTGVDNVRESVIDSVRFAPNTLTQKVYIIDEVHMLSASAFNALLKTLEEPPEHVLFVLATTEIHKVPETIISRCQRFDFKRISLKELVARLKRIVEAEDMIVAEEVLQEIARHSGGCARDAESLLGQVLALGEKEIGMEEASLVLPATQIELVEEFIGSLKAESAARAISQLNDYLEQGVDLRHFVQDCISYLRDKLFDSLSGKETNFQTAFLEKAIQGLLDASSAIREEYIPQLPVELAIVKLCGIGRHSVSPQAKQSEDEGSQVGFQKQGVDLSRQVKVGELAAEAVFDSVPVISLDDVKKKWPEVYEQIKSCNVSLPMMMKSCEVCGIEGEHVELGFEYDLYVQTVNQEKNRRIIEGVFEQVLGKKLRVKAIHTKAVEQDETVDGLLQEFGGSVV